jgi:pimeloyl-ACP methyl ester carboxylesterase
VRRESGWLQLGEGALFVHLHEPVVTSSAGLNVLIVQGIGDDYFHGYRALRFLADCLAEAGHRCVRFDYSGCGHSLDRTEADLISRWENDVTQVAAWFRSHQGIDRLCFVANRSGALFINQALAAGDELVLWGAEKSGRSWVRESRTLAAMNQRDRTPEGFESGGIWFDGASLEVLSGRQFAPVHAPRRALVINRPDRVGSADILSGSTSRIDSEYTECFREPHHAKRPEALCRMIVDWASCDTVSVPFPSTGQSSVDLTRSGLLSRIEGDGWTEQVCHVNGLFAICTAGQPGGSILLLGNAGSVHSVGPNRLNVELARQLALENITTLRYDLCNLGDSVCEGLATSPAIVEENHPYPASADHDVSGVVMWAKVSGYSRVILAGLCSGAYAAFDFARSHLKAKPDEVLLINPLTFDWQAGMSLEVPSEFATVAQGRAYRKAVRDRSRWMRVIRGDVNIRQFVLHLVRSSLDRYRVIIRQLGIALHLSPQPQLARDLLRIAATGTRIRFYFSTGEPGIDMLGRAGRSCLEALKKLRLMSIELITDADHTFRNRERRRELLDLITRNLAHDRNA